MAPALKVGGGEKRGGSRGGGGREGRRAEVHFRVLYCYKNNKEDIVAVGGKRRDSPPLRRVTTPFSLLCVVLCNFQDIGNTVETNKKRKEGFSTLVQVFSNFLKLLKTKYEVLRSLEKAVLCPPPPPFPSSL